jgi:hypothetical protein
MKNRDPQHWRDSQQLEHVLGKYIISDRPMSEEEWARERADVPTSSRLWVMVERSCIATQLPARFPERRQTLQKGDKHCINSSALLVTDNQGRQGIVCECCRGDVEEGY